MRALYLAGLVLVVACEPALQPKPGPTDLGISCEDTPTHWLGGYEDMGLSNRAQGLWTNPNVQTDAPDGANDKAENIELDRSGLARPRAGQRRLMAAYPDTSQRFRAGTTYQGYGFEFASDGPGDPGTLYRRDPITEALTSVLSMSAPAGVIRPRFADMGGVLHITTSTGVLVAESATSPFAPAGVERMPDISSVASDPGTPTHVPSQSAVAYRSVLVRPDSNGMMRFGVPSSRVVFANTSASDVSTSTSNILPTTARVGDHVRLYRSASVGVAVDPGDTLYLAVEVILTSADVLTGSVILYDVTPEILLGEPLYTNATQEGILGANEQPPLARDMLVFGEGTGAGRLLLANTQHPQRLIVRLIGVPDVGTDVTVDGFNASVSIVPSGSVAKDVEAYARLLVDAFSGALSPVTAYYLSGANDPPGIFALERRSAIDGPFLVSATDDDAFEPPLLAPVSSTADVRPNGISVSDVGNGGAYSRYDQDRLLIGRKDRAILRIAALRNDVFAFKDGEGIFKLTPLADGWNVEQMSQDANLLIPESVAVLDNQILAYTTRGIVAVDAYGVEELDLPVKNYTEALAAFPPEVVQTTTFAAADSTRLCYWLWFPETADATVATRALLWNGRASPPAWTERTDAATGGYVSPDGFLMLGEAPQPGFTASRRTGSVDDFQGPDGEAYTVRISWPNRAEGMPGASKHYRQARLYFEKPVGSKVAPLPVQWLFTNDYNNTSPVRTNQVYGLPYSTMEPDPGYQRTSDLGIEVAFPVLRAYPVVKGVEEVVSSVSPVRMRK